MPAPLKAGVRGHRPWRPPVPGRPSFCRAHGCSLPDSRWQDSSGAHRLHGGFSKTPDGAPHNIRLCSVRGQQGLSAPPPRRAQPSCNAPGRHLSFTLKSAPQYLMALISLPAGRHPELWAVEGGVSGARKPLQPGSQLRQVGSCPRLGGAKPWSWPRGPRAAVRAANPRVKPKNRGEIRPAWEAALTPHPDSAPPHLDPRPGANAPRHQERRSKGRGCVPCVFGVQGSSPKACGIRPPWTSEPGNEVVADVQFR